MYGVTSPTTSTRDRTAIALATLVALAAILRFATLDLQSLWLDETATVVLVRHSFRDMLSSLPSAESSPPLYFIVVWAWSKVFGTGAIGIRSLSALLGTLTVPVAYAAARPVSRRAGLWAAAIAAASPLTFYYSQEARAYALLILLCGLSFVLFQRALDAPRPGNLALWAGVSALALLTHYFAMFVLLPEAVWLARRHGVRALAPYAGALGVVGAALLPLAARQRSDSKSNWIEDTSLASRVAQAPKQFLVGIDSPAEIAATAAAVALVIAAVGLLVTRGGERERRLAERTAAIVAVAIALPLVLSASGAIDVFNGRNVVGAWVPAAVVVAIAVAAGRRAGAVVGGLLVALSVAVIVGVLADPTVQRDDWRDAAKTLAAERTPVIVSPANGDVPLRVYLPGIRRLKGHSIRGRELAFLAFPTRRTGRSSLPPAPPRRGPAGFRLAGVRATDTYAISRFVADRPVTVPRRTLARVLGDPGAVILAPPSLSPPG
jgi:mannosyltransferase